MALAVAEERVRFWHRRPDDWLVVYPGSGVRLVKEGGRSTVEEGERIVLDSTTGTLLVPPILRRMVAPGSWYRPSSLNPVTAASLDPAVSDGDSVRRIRVDMMGKVEELTVDTRLGLILERRAGGRVTQLEEVASDLAAPHDLTGRPGTGGGPVGTAVITYDPRSDLPYRSLWEVAIAGIPVFIEEEEQETVDTALDWSRRRAAEVIVRP